MPLTRRALVAAAAVVVVAGCTTPEPPTPTPTGSATPQSPTPTPTPAPRLTDPGAARQVIGELLQQSGDSPVLKIDLTVDTAELSVLADGEVLAWLWDQGTITSVTSDIEFVGQTSFNPAEFAFDDLNRIFGLAGALSGSTSNQQLHIVDYNNGEVLMTVTTRPESRPVFFRSDASPIHELDYASTAGIEEGLRDAISNRTQLAAIGYDKTGLWADAPDPVETDVMVRRTRPALLPAFSSNRREAAPLTQVSPVDANPEVLSRLMKELPTKLNKEPNVAISWTIDMSNGGSEPTITLDVGGQRVITDLQGLDVTSTYPR